MNWLWLLSILAVVGLPLEARAQETITGTPGFAQRSAVVNFSDLARRRTLAPANKATAGPTARPRPMQRPNNRTSGAPASLFSVMPEATVATGPSPLPITSFLALLDNDTVVPPDTMGAVGPNHIMTTLNSEVRIQTKTGMTTSTVDLASFWAGVGNPPGNPDPFDPRLAYDPVGGRWIFSACADGGLPSAAVLVGVSATSDPTGDWYLYSTDVDPNDLLSADFDNLGFNKKWIVVSANIFTNGAAGKFDSVHFYVFDKADLYMNGSAAFTLLKMSAATQAFAVAPGQTFDPDLDDLYLVEDWFGPSGQLRVDTITGPVTNATLALETAYPTTTNTWAFVAADNFAPQLGSNHGIDVGDSRILSCSYRNGSLWVTQNGLLPWNAPKRCAAQWWQFQPDGTVQQFGRVDDPAGKNFYVYPSLAANASNDVLVGYTRFSSTQHPSANYAFRYATDPPNTLRADTVLKAGDGVYYAPAGKLNRWGDFSATVVDPVDNLTLWTIQEYAAGSNRWSTWWGRIDATPQAISLTQPTAGTSFPPSATVTLTASQINTNLTFTNVEFYAGTTKIGETNAAPFIITWTPTTNGTVTLQAIATDDGAGQHASKPVQITLGDLMSPVGTWETTLGGFARGAAVLEFADDFTFAGHGLALGTYGLFTITGTWGYNAKHQTIGAYAEQLNGTEIYAGNLLAKISRATKFSAQITPTGTVKRLILGGIPAATVPDLSGTWTGVMTVARTKLSSTATLTPSSDYLNVLDLSLLVSNETSTGSALVTTRGAINVATTNGTAATLPGKFKAATFKAPAAIALKGTDIHTNKLSLTVVRP